MMTPFQTLISVTALQTALQSVLSDTHILDCRARLGEPGFGAEAYASGHIPGAQRGDLDTDFASIPGAGGRHPLPSAESLVQKCRAWGINDASQVVVYDDMGGLFAARAWWLLRWLGHADVAVLDGGWPAWLAANGASETQTPAPAKGNFSHRPSLTRVVTADDLLARPPRGLLDARAEERFAGIREPIDHTAGHIPGARCVPATGNLDATQHFLPPAALAARFVQSNEALDKTMAAEGVTPDCVCYCGSGVTAAHNILAMRLAGFGEPALYPGSWSEWIEDPARPIATGT